MRTEQRIRELCSQLLRAENPLVVETVAAELRAAIDEYVQRQNAPVELKTLTPETA